MSSLGTDVVDVASVLPVYSVKYPLLAVGE